MEFYDILNLEDEYLAEVVEFDDKTICVKWFDYKFPKYYENIEELQSELSGSIYKIVKNWVYEL